MSEQEDQEKEDLARVRQCKYCTLPIADKEVRGLVCKPCLKAKKHEEYTINKDRILLRQKLRYQNDPSKFKITNRQSMGFLILAKPMIQSYYGACSRSRKDGIPFNIEYKDLEPLPEFCPILGIRLHYNSGLRTDNSPSIDRVIPRLGYVKGNVHVISFRANKIKSDSTLEELEQIVKFLKRHINKSS